MINIKNKKTGENMIKKFYRWYRDIEKLVDISAGFTLILAFVIVLPSMEEIKYAWLGSFIALAVAVRIIFSRLEIEQPKLKLEEDFKRSIEKLEDEMKIIRRKLKKIKGGEDGREEK